MPKLIEPVRAESILAARVPVTLRRAVEDLARLNDRTVAAEIRVALRRHVLAVGGNPGPDSHD